MGEHAYRSRVGIRTFAVVFLLWWAAFSAWAIATPSWGAPDEFQHAFRSYALVRGAVYVKPQTASYGTGGYVDVPTGWVATAQNYRCFTHKSDVIPACAGPITDNETSQRVASTAARYNPVYYAIVGIGTLGTTPTNAIYVMRFISAALSALFLTFATTSAMQSQRPAIATSTVILACTPMVGFLAGSINPNSLEISAAMSAWVNGFSFLRRNDDGDRMFFLRRTAISMATFTVARALSPLWLVIMVASLCAAALRKQDLHWLRSHGRVYIGDVALITIAAFSWTLAAHTLTLNVNTNPTHFSYLHSLRNTWQGGSRESYFLYGTIGTFGWQDAWVPELFQQPWIIATCALLGILLIKGTTRARLCIAGLFLATVFVPILIEAKNLNTSGLVWQARYTMPISLGVVLLAGMLLSESGKWKAQWSEQRALSIFFCIAATWTSIIGFLYALGRNTVGGERIAISGTWNPPVPGLVLVLAQTLTLIALSAMAIRANHRSLEYPKQAPELA